MGPQSLLPENAFHSREQASKCPPAPRSPKCLSEHSDSSPTKILKLFLKPSNSVKPSTSAELGPGAPLKTLVGLLNALGPGTPPSAPMSRIRGHRFFFFAQASHFLELEGRTPSQKMVGGRGGGGSFPAMKLCA